MATPVTPQERKAELRRKHWDPWDSYERLTQDGAALGWNAESKKARDVVKADSVAQLLAAGLESLPKATSESREVVYFIQGVGGGPVKIGHTTLKGVRRRLRELQPSNPDELVIRHMLDGGYWLEAALHVLFSEQRIRGEWFKPTPEMQRIAPEIVLGA